MTYTKGTKICVVGKNEVREKVVRAIVGNKQPYNYDEECKVYRVNIPTTLHDDLDLFVWDVEELHDLAPRACRVVIFVGIDDLNANMRYFRERWPTCDVIVHLGNGDINDDNRRKLLQDILSLMDKDLLLASKKVDRHTQVAIDRLKKLQQELESIISELEEGMM